MSLDDRDDDTDPGLPGSTANDADIIDDLIGRYSLDRLLELLAARYEEWARILSGAEWEAAWARAGVAHDVADTLVPVVAEARMQVVRRVRDGAALARELGL